MRTSIIILVIIGTGIQLIQGQSITQWRGLDRTGYYPVENVSNSWPEDGLQLQLHVKNLPETFSSVVVYEDVMYTTGIVKEEEILTAIDFQGNILWSTTYGDAWDGTFKPARCTPTIENGYAYMVSGRGSLGCVNLEDGKLVWSKDGYSSFGARTGNWGTAESPLIVDNKMIYTPCGDQTTMVALDKKDGSILWQSESIGDQSAYVSPVLMKLNGTKLIVTVSGNYVIGVNAEDGDILWKLDYSSISNPGTGVDINPVSPLIRGKEIFITSGYDHVGLMLVLADDCRSVSVKWTSKDMDVHHGGVVEVDGYLYGSNFNSVFGGNWVCLDWDTGQLMFEDDRYNKGQVIAMGDKLICYEERKGRMLLVKANPEVFEVISEFKVDQGSGPHWSHPSVYDGNLYLRHGKSLMVYNL
jgi:outer membrane protein assembly factor BamB